MIPSKIIGKTSGENWIGLIDATYGIILTLLVIELPTIILESIEKNKAHINSPYALATVIILLVIGYFAVFTVIYDIWSYHKTLLFDAKKHRLFALATGWVLFLSSLIPPFYYLVNHFAVDQVLQASDHKILLIISRLFVFCLIAVVYLILAVLSKSEKRQRGQSEDKKAELEFIFGTSSTKAIITILLAFFVDAQSTYLPPPIGITILGILTYAPINLFKLRTPRG